MRGAISGLKKKIRSVSFWDVQTKRCRWLPLEALTSIPPELNSRV